MTIWNNASAVMYNGALVNSVMYNGNAIWPSAVETGNILLISGGDTGSYSSTSIFSTVPYNPVIKSDGSSYFKFIWDTSVTHLSGVFTRDNTPSISPNIIRIDFPTVTGMQRFAARNTKITGLSSYINAPVCKNFFSAFPGYFAGRTASVTADPSETQFDGMFAGGSLRNVYFNVDGSNGRGTAIWMFSSCYNLTSVNDSTSLSGSIRYISNNLASSTSTAYMRGSFYHCSAYSDWTQVSNSIFYSSMCK